MSTFKNWGSSSRLVRRMKAPMGVMRESARVAWVILPSVSLCGFMLRNLKTLKRLPLRPSRGWRNRTGPFEDSLIAIAKTIKRGISRISTHREKILSKRSLAIPRTPPFAGRFKSTTGMPKNSTVLLPRMAMVLVSGAQRMSTSEFPSKLCSNGNLSDSARGSASQTSWMPCRMTAAGISRSSASDSMSGW